MLAISTSLLLVFTFVANDALEENTNKYFLGKSYNFNHPPLFENFKLSDEDKLKSRKVRQTVPTEDDTSKEYSQVNVPNSSMDNISLTLSAKIAVPVTYDTNQDVIHSINKTSNTSNKIKKRKRKRRPNISNNETVMVHKIEEIIDTIRSTTERIPTTYAGPKTVVPKVFTKRPPEDNPVIKKVRQRDPVVKILDSSNHVYSHTGNFHYSYEGEDGTKISSEGELKSFNDEKTGEAVVGSVFYKDKDGNDVSLSYTADENGYRPKGTHLPTPPPIPPAIARALAHLATKTTPQPVTEPSL